MHWKEEIFILLLSACTVHPNGVAFLMYCCGLKVVFVPLHDEEGWEEMFPFDK